MTTSMFDQVDLVSAEELARRVPMTVAIDALADLFAGDDATAPPRLHAHTPSGDLLVMPAASSQAIGTKLVTVTPDNSERDLPLIHGLYVAFDVETGQPRSLVDGAALTGLRTAAVSGLATRLAARPDSSRLLVYGAGLQARTHVDAMRAVLPIEVVEVVSRTTESAAMLVAQLRDQGLDARVGDDDSLARADVICACTSSPTPVVAGADLQPGTHVNAVGAYKPTTRELDSAVMQRGRILVEDRAAACAEGGDLAIPIEAGQLSVDDIVADLSEAVAGTAVRRTDDDITVFKSVGMSVEDLAVVACLRSSGV